MKRCFQWLCVAGLGLVVVGCGGPTVNRQYSAFDLQPVSGRVTLDGDPLPNATVAFRDDDDSRTAIGKTDALGNYTLMFDSEQPGCTPGTKTVIITTVEQGEGFSGEEMVVEDDEGNTVTVEEVVPARYNSASTLTATVTSDGAQTFDFDLTTSED